MTETNPVSSNLQPYNPWQAKSYQAKVASSPTTLCIEQYSRAPEEDKTITFSISRSHTRATFLIKTELKQIFLAILLILTIISPKPSQAETKRSLFISDNRQFAFERSEYRDPIRVMVGQAGILILFEPSSTASSVQAFDALRLLPEQVSSSLYLSYSDSSSNKGLKMLYTPYGHWPVRGSFEISLKQHSIKISYNHQTRYISVFRESLQKEAEADLLLGIVNHKIAFQIQDLNSERFLALSKGVLEPLDLDKGLLMVSNRILPAGQAIGFNLAQQSNNCFERSDSKILTLSDFNNIKNQRDQKKRLTLLKRALARQASFREGLIALRSSANLALFYRPSDNQVLTLKQVSKDGLDKLICLIE